MRASVIVPVRNGARTIAATLDSLATQTLARDSFEVIVVENGSTDATASVVSSYPVRLLRRAAVGTAAARNAGLEVARGEIVAFTDADCVVASEWLEELIRAYADSRCGGAGGPVLTLERAAAGIVERYAVQRPPVTNYMRDGRAGGEYLPYLVGANASFRRSVLEAVGGCDELCVAAEDIDLSWRVQMRSGTDLLYVPNARVWHRGEERVGDLARQYRRYGFGEIELDTIYAAAPGYPRDAFFQLRRLAAQGAALPRYAASALWRCAGWLCGRASAADVAAPLLAMLVEGSVVAGKLEAMARSRLMRDRAGLSRRSGRVT